MKNFIVKDLMVPISEYATVPEAATLFEAVLALEKAQEHFQQNRYSHRAVLIMDKNKKVLGKLSQMDFLCALEPRDENLQQIRKFKQFGFTRKAVALQQEEYLKTSPPILDVYSKAAKMKVTEFMQGMKDRGARFLFGSDHSISTNTDYDDYMCAIDSYREHMMY